MADESQVASVDQAEAPAPPEDQPAPAPPPAPTSPEPDFPAAPLYHERSARPGSGRSGQQTVSGED